MNVSFPMITSKHTMSSCESLYETAKNLHTWYSLPVDSWIEVMAKLTYPSILGLFQINGEMRMFCDDKVWKRILLLRYPRLAHYLDILYSLVPYWDVDSWEAIHRGLWLVSKFRESIENENARNARRNALLRYKMSDQQRMAEEHGITWDRSKKRKIIDLIVDMDKSELSKSEEPYHSPPDTGLFVLERPDTDIIVKTLERISSDSISDHYTPLFGYVNSESLDDVETILDPASCRNVLPLLLVLISELEGEDCIISKTYLILGLDKYINQAVLTALVGRYARVKSKISHLRNVLEDREVPMTREAFRVILSALNITKEELLQSEIIATVIIHGGLPALNALESRYGDLKEQPDCIVQIYSILCESRFWVRIQNPRDKNTTQMAKNIVNCLDFLYERELLTRNDLVRFIGKLGGNAYSTFFKQLQSLSGAFNFTYTEIIKINEIIHDYCRDNRSFDVKRE